LVQAIAVPDAATSLAEVESRFGLQRVENEQFFSEWQQDLPALSDAERAKLQILRRRLLYHRAEGDLLEILRGRIDVLIVQRQFWTLVLESKKTTISTRSALPQALAYMMATPNVEEAQVGMLTNGDDVLFIKLVLQPEKQYSLSRVFSLYTLTQEWQAAWQILKKLASSIAI
jgi:hypothetical protein